MSEFHFAWVTAADLVWDTDFIRDDEDIFSLSIQHAEGDFPTLELDIENPRVGLLTAGRKQWCWLSWTDDDAVNHPLFFGRLVGVPSALQDNVVRVTFVARPLDFDEQKESVAFGEDGFNEVYNEIWLSEEDRQNPDMALEFVPKLWHIDRTTLEVTVSDIISGEDGDIEFEDVLYDSVGVSYSQSPARKAIVTATVNWTQKGSGSFPITNQIIEKFKDGRITKGLTSARGNPHSGNGMIALIPGEDMINNWPKTGESIGNGWTVTLGSAVAVGGPPMAPVLVPNTQGWNYVKGWLNSPDLLGITMRSVFERSPGFIVEVNPSWVGHSTFGVAHGPIDIVWFPIWLIAPKLEVGWDASRPRVEEVTFELDADVQPLLTDPGEGEIIRMTIGPADVDAYIGDSRRSRFFSTENGVLAFQSLIAQARAALLSRARAVDVEFDVPFAEGIALSCRMNGQVVDPRLPGGQAAGKVKAYTLSADGDSGALLAHVVLGCTVGRDGTTSPLPGTATYVASGYVDDGYQVFTGQTFNIPGYSDVTFGGLQTYPISDDGVNLFSVRRDEFLHGITVTGHIDEQQEKAETPADPSRGQSAIEVIDKVSGFTTTVEVKLRPILNNSFSTSIAPTVSVLKVPRTIDLENV